MLNTLKIHSLPRGFAAALAAASLLGTAAAAQADDAGDGEAPRTVELAPPGACAKPRGLPQAAQPAGFEIAGAPAERLNPAQVSSQTRVLSEVVAVAPAPPAPPGPSLCDDPAACSSGGGPIFVESEPVPGLPPGL